MKYMPIDSEYIHYGTNNFDINQFRNVVNDNWVKPIGGFWASLVNDEYGWAQWATEADYLILSDEWIKFKLISNRILLIDDYSQLNDLPHIAKQPELDRWNIYDDLKHYYLDFEKLSRICDGMYVKITNDIRFEWGLQT